MVYILIIVTLLLIISVVSVLYDIHKEKKYLYRSMSLKESLDLVGMPIITICQDTSKFNFILDTGSNFSQINKEVLQNIKYEDNKNEENEVIGIEGNKTITKLCTIDFTYKNQNFTNDFIVNDLSKAFSIVKQNSGVQVHGIIGNDFIVKYKYILDFDKLVAYSKK